MANATETAMSLLHRAEDALRRRARRVIPADEANLKSMAESPQATIGLTPDQRQQLEKIERPSVTA